MAHELITQAAYARRRGVSPAAVNKAVKRCRIPLIDGKIDPIAADALWAARTNPDQQRRALAQQRPAVAPLADPAGDPIARSWRDRRDRAAALREEIALARERGTVHDHKACLAGLVRQFSTVRQRLLAIPSRVAGQLAPTPERTRVADLLEREIHDALHEIAGTDPNE